MIGGQVVDVSQTGHALSQEQLDFIYKLKTGALIEASMMIGAILAGASDEEVSRVEKIAADVGLAFQIQDDILDYSGTDAVGKPLGADILEQKMTIPLLGALKSVTDEVAAEVRGKVRDIVGHPEYREDIIGFVKDSGGLEYAVTRLSAYVKEAVEALDVLPDSPAKEYLVELAYFTAARAM